MQVGREGQFALASDEGWLASAEGVERRVRMQIPEMMVVEFRFQAGAVGAMHSHPHVQTSYVASGAFDVTLGGTTLRIGTGGGYLVPPGLQHGVVAVEPGVLVDVFAPRRDDFLTDVD
jgi:quercetin dioxygenase-like cupin family protein